ncbi:conserved membrane hypothetical protein [Planktothrix serta PCC 8927]|uniref:Signal transduction histidine kinase LytS n=1 Tax=Planktothrix serta PCC 8927 TaxID=671068 RepID=A0A7Z9E1H1_9CYAN|nr:histidine kinase [Planktothrix serta]VXD22802.1 conserved membrane hypothetical protein [Planktothrix serta PCC 8927]
MISHSNPVKGQNRRAVGMFPNRRSAESALYALRDSGFPMDHVSVITRDDLQDSEIAGADVKDSVSEHRTANHVDNKAEEGAAVGITTGGVLGGLTGLLVGLGTLAIPGIGPIMLAGATATTLATTLAGTAIGAATGGLLGALIGLGIPEEDAKIYNERIGRGEYLIIVDGNESEIAHAHQILQTHNIEEYRVYDAPGVASMTPAHLNQDITPDHHHQHSGAVSQNKHAIGVFSNSLDTEQAINDLRNAGFPLSQISLVSSHPRRNAFTDIDLRDRFEAMRYGIPVEQARAYHDRLDQGDNIVIVSGTEEQVRQAETILRRHKIEQWQVYDPTVISSTANVEHSRPVEMSAPLESSKPLEHHHSKGTKVTPVNPVAPVAPVSSPAAYPVTPTTAKTPGTERSHHPYKRAIGVFNHRHDAEVALTDLRDSGFPMGRVSVIVKDIDGHHPLTSAGQHNLGVDLNRRTHGNKADEGAKAGAALGGLGGLVVGLGTLALPGVGPVIAGGAAATALATSLSGGATGGLVGLGVPENRAHVYNEHLNRGDYLIMVDGFEEELRRAEPIFKRHSIHEWGIYDATDIDVSADSHPNPYTPRPTSKSVERDRTNSTW